MSLKSVCEETRVSEVNLRALEEQNFAALPAETFIRGLLGIYARYLGVDPAHVTARFMRERDQVLGGGKRGRTASPGHQILAPKKLAEPAHVSSITMAAILLLCFAALFTGFCLYTSWNPFSFLASESEAIQSAVMQSLPGATATPPALPAPAAEKGDPASLAAPAETAAPAAPPLDSVSVEFLKDARLEVTRDDQPPVSIPYKKGEKDSWSGVGTIQLSFDQPASATILVNGQPVPFPPESGGLYTLRLPADPAAPAAP
jgi:cytoskeletal protein RodZ